MQKFRVRCIPYIPKNKESRPGKFIAAAKAVIPNVKIHYPSDGKINN